MIPDVIKTALQEYGEAEILGLSHNKRILEYHSVTTLKASSDEVFWCSSFICWVHEQCGISHPSSARAADWREWGKTTNTPRIGDVAVFTREGGSGHVGLFIRQKDELVYVLGGNQGNKVTIAAYPKSRLVGYRSAV